MANYKTLFSILFLAVLGACDHASDILDKALSNSPDELSQKAGNGKAIDKYLYAIALEYGLNGVEQNKEKVEFLKLEAQSITEQRYISANNSVIKVEVPELSQVEVQAIEGCIAAINTKNPTNYSMSYCGGKYKYNLYKQKWDEAIIRQKISETNHIQMVQNNGANVTLNNSNNLNDKQAMARSSFDEFMEFLATAPSADEIAGYLSARKYKKLENINRDIPYLNEVEHLYFNIEDYLCSGVPIRISSFETINNNLGSKSFYNINMDRGYPKTFECSNSTRTEAFDHKYLKDYLLSHGWKIDKYDRASRFLTIHFIKGNAKILIEYQSVYLENVLLVTHNFNIEDFWNSYAYVNSIVYGYSLK